MKTLILLFTLCSLQSYAKDLKEDVFILSSEKFEGRKPGEAGHKLARDYLKERIKSLGLEFEDITQLSPLPWLPRMHNLVGKLKRRESSNKCIVLTAHYDHVGVKNGSIYPGAMDNAAGVALVLDIAKQVIHSNLNTLADFFFVFPDQEESYLAGSFRLVKQLQKQCKKIVFNFNFDVVGAPFFKGLEDHVLLLGHESSFSFDGILPSAVDYAKKELGLQVDTGGVYVIEPFKIPRSDYANFRRKKIPFLFMTNGTPWFYHDKEDTFDKIDFKHLSDLSKFSFNLLEQYALKEKIFRV